MSLESSDIQHRKGQWVGFQEDGIDPSLEFPTGTDLETAMAIATCPKFVNHTLPRAREHSFSPTFCLGCEGRVTAEWISYLRKFRVTGRCP